MGPAVTLDREDIDAVARRVVELLEDEAPHSAEPRRLVDAATAARLLGVSRATVYAKADELGAIRVGEGKRARLRFDPARMIGLGKADANGSQAHHRRRSRRSSRSDPNLLPIRGRNRSGGPLRS
jgi:hypothetical protein